MKTLLATFALLLACHPVLAQNPKDLNVNYMLRGHFYAQSSTADTDVPGGFGVSDNQPQKVTTACPFQQSGLFLWVDTSEVVAIPGGYNGYCVYLVNKTNDIVEFKALDSRLSIIAEAKTGAVWRPIEYLPSSWCGNSYHMITLASKEYWEFMVPRFAGKRKALLRYRLVRYEGDDIVSNEFRGFINRGQFHEKQGHSPQDLMDPYYD